VNVGSAGHGKRSREPFVVINCGAIADTKSR
jgi:hypothetical protein